MVLVRIPILHKIYRVAMKGKNILLRQPFELCQFCSRDSSLSADVAAMSVEWRDRSYGRHDSLSFERSKEQVARRCCRCRTRWGIQREEHSAKRTATEQVSNY